MLIHPTLDQMASLGLTGMAAAWRALAEQDPGDVLDRNEWLGMMLDREVVPRRQAIYQQAPERKDALSQCLH
jgi:hypothetical protein